MTSKTTPHFHVDTADWQPFPEYEGQQAILYRSEDGTRLAGSFKESGTHTLTMPFDEFIYVIAGTCDITVEDQHTIHLRPGSCCYLQQGDNVTFAMSEDFHDVTVLISDTPGAVNDI